MKGFVSFMKIKMFILTFELIPWLWFWRKFTRKYLKSTYFSAFIGFDKVDVCSKICCLKLNHATVKQQNKCWLKKIVKSCGDSIIWRKFLKSTLFSYFSAFIGFDKDIYCKTCCPKLNHATDSIDSSKIKGDTEAPDTCPKCKGKVFENEKIMTKYELQITCFHEFWIFCL